MSAALAVVIVGAVLVIPVYLLTTAWLEWEQDKRRAHGVGETEGTQ